MRRVRYCEFTPPPSLRPYLRCFWIMEDPWAGDARVERVVPDGCVELVVHYGAPFARWVDAEAHVQPRAIVAGQLRTATHLEATGPAGMVAARFEPWGAAAFVGDTLTALTDRVLDLGELWSDDGPHLAEQMQDAGGDRERLALFVDLLQRRLPARNDDVDCMRAAAARIAAARGNLAVDHLARDLGWSRRHLERLFHEHVGLTAKTLCRIERFGHVVEALGQDATPRLADLALSLGYADQPHLARDFRSLAGVPISTYRREQHALSDHLTAGRSRREPDHRTGVSAAHRSVGSG